ncbi:lactase, partial [Haematococcus lacustris]
RAELAVLDVVGPGGSWAAQLSTRTGWLVGLSGLGGEPLLAAPLQLNLWRAPTDNDRGGFGSSSYAARWLAAGLDRLDVEEGSPAGASSEVGLSAEGEVGLRVTYTFHGCGLLAMKWEVDAHNALPAPLAPGLMSVGVTTSLAAGLDQVTWYGRGPHESYWDRRSSASVGLFSSPVDDMHTPYVFPQAQQPRPP